MKTLAQIEGRLGKDAEMKELPGGKKVTRFSVAVNKKIRRKKETKTVTDWYSVEAWGHNATPASRLRKGDPVFVQGELRTGSYTKGDVTIPTTFITVVSLRKLDYSIFGNDDAPEHDPIDTEADPDAEGDDVPY
jgi:single-strand DNA-binding protein